MVDGSLVAPARRRARAYVRSALVTLGAVAALGLAAVPNASAECLGLPVACLPGDGLPELPDGTTGAIEVAGPVDVLTAFLPPKRTKAARALYRRLLPPAFTVPKQPMVRVHFWSFENTPGQRGPSDITPSGSYLEYAIALRTEYHGATGWYMLSVAINSFAGWYGGTYLGAWPKYLATMSFAGDRSGWKASSSVQRRPTMSIDWSPAKVAIDKDLAADSENAHPYFTSLPAPRSAGIWRLSADLYVPPVTSAPPQSGVARVTLDGDLNRVDAESPTQLPYLLGPCESLADLVALDQVVPATYWHVPANFIAGTEAKIGPGGPASYPGTPPTTCPPAKAPRHRRSAKHQPHKRRHR